jgi:type IV pilus assembly protein PilO
MTISGDYNPTQGQGTADAATYPSVFGVSFTPTIGGIGLAVLGILGAGYLLLNLVQPLWLEKQTIEQDIAEKKARLANQAAELKQIEQVKTDLETAKQRQSEVLSLFANEIGLKTLLLDLSRVVKSRNGTLVRFEPAEDPNPQVVNDSSLGTQANGKVSRQTYKVEFEGNFEETRAIMLTMERLQPLLVVKNLKSELDTQRASLRKTGNRSAVLEFDQTATRLKTAFDLLALLPVITPATPAGTTSSPGASPSPVPTQTQ